MLHEPIAQEEPLINEGDAGCSSLAQQLCSNLIERRIVKEYFEDEFDIDESKLGVVPIQKKPQEKRPPKKKKTDNVRQARINKQKRQQIESGE